MRERRSMKKGEKEEAWKRKRKKNEKRKNVYI
jgi:hypothetical protein